MTNCIADRKYRLPTEAEWEYAARGGEYWQKHPFIYGGSNKLEDVGWYSENSHQETKRVGLKTPNLLGLYDMSGNVCEWCRDWYGRGFYKTSTGAVSVNPTGSATGSFRVLRGGGRDFSARRCRSTFRSNYSPSFRFLSVGFRLVLSSLVQQV